MDDLRIRPPDPDEIEALVRIWRRARDQAMPLLEARLGRSPGDDLRHFREHVVPRCAIRVAASARGTELLGFLAFHEALLDHLYVDPRAQSRGAGSTLLAGAKELMPGGFSLYTHARNARARRFYEGRGLRPVAFGLSPPPECEPDVRYVWSPASGPAHFDRPRKPERHRALGTNLLQWSLPRRPLHDEPETHHP